MVGFQETHVWQPEIVPMPPEVVAKLEVAVAHRNLRRAVAVLQTYIESLRPEQEITLDTPVAMVYETLLANTLEKNGIHVMRDFKGVPEEWLAGRNNIGPARMREIKAGIDKMISQRKKMD